jgi:hypothetical protein
MFVGPEGYCFTAGRVPGTDGATIGNSGRGSTVPRAQI